MGNEASSIQSHFTTKMSSTEDKCTSSSENNFNFEVLQEIQSDSLEKSDLVKFLDHDFKEKKNASKQIQFQITNQIDNIKKNSVFQDQTLESDLEEFQQSENYKSSFYSEMKDMNSIISEQSNISANGSSSQHLKTFNERAPQNNQFKMRSSFSSYDSKFKRLNIKQQKFVKIRNHKFENSYQCLEKIGQGATGNVFTVKCKKTNQIRAVKVLKNKIMKRMCNKKTLYSELDLLKSFDHLNIIKVYDVFHTADFYDVVTQYCPGGTLLEYALKNTIDLKLMKVIFKQILGALCYLHSQSIVHRDIKLENIVFKTHPSQCKNLDDVQIKLIDFGLAKRTKFKSINKDSPCLGTPLYMAPEIIKGHYSFKCDIWACGVMLHFLLFNQFPFYSTELQLTYKKITSQQIDYSKSQWKKIPNDLKILLQKMLLKSSAHRITACEALKSQWFSDLTRNKGTKTQKNLIFQKLTSYKKENNFISIIESYIIFAKSTKSHHQQNLIKLFQKFDQNNNGSIEIHELQQILKEKNILNNQNRQYSIKQLIQTIDKNNSGKIEVSEFLSLFYDRCELFTDRCLSNAFDFFDQDKDGLINRQELARMLQGCDNEEFENLWMDLDTDEDNNISKQEFISYIKRANDMIESASSTEQVLIDQQ